jgi:hypothetical protein
MIKMAPWQRSGPSASRVPAISRCGTVQATIEVSRTVACRSLETAPTPGALRAGLPMSGSGSQTATGPKRPAIAAARASPLEVAPRTDAFGRPAIFPQPLRSHKHVRAISCGAVRCPKRRAERDFEDGTRSAGVRLLETFLKYPPTTGDDGSHKPRVNGCVNWSS